jgi:hypothetical protein
MSRKKRSGRTRVEGEKATERRKRGRTFVKDASVVVQDQPTEISYIFVTGEEVEGQREGGEGAEERRGRVLGRMKGR